MPRIVVIAGLGFFGLFAAAIAGLGFAWAALEQEHVSPEQPIAFDHQKHAGERKIACLHCHQFPDKGPRSTPPAMSVCAKCHGQMETKHPEVLKLQSYLKEQKPVEWIKVHDLPWHVRFTHKRHIKYGQSQGIEPGDMCKTCHGFVETMPQVRRVRSLEMGWCVNCHQQKGASTDCWTCHI
jgi:hypothetical protein